MKYAALALALLCVLPLAAQKDIKPTQAFTVRGAIVDTFTVGLAQGPRPSHLTPDQITPLHRIPK